ncbi:MAG: RNA-protein complex protein Nop10 [Candidatus Bathyarchaeota archaeon]
MSPVLLRRCKKCGEYTLNKISCPKCGGEVYTPAPPKFSPDDKYAKYRRMMKEFAKMECKN